MRTFLGRLLMATALSVGIATPSLAAAPLVETIAIDVTFTPPQLSAACGFSITRQVAGTLAIRAFVDSSGGFKRELDAYRLTETRSANGRTLIGRTSQVIVVDLRPDGSFTVAFIGTDFRLPVPGAGVSFGSVGRFVLLFSADNELIDVLQDVGDARSDTGAICAALSPTG